MGRKKKKADQHKKHHGTPVKKGEDKKHQSKGNSEETVETACAAQDTKNTNLDESHMLESHGSIPGNEETISCINRTEKTTLGARHSSPLGQTTESPAAIQDHVERKPNISRTEDLASSTRYTSSPPPEYEPEKNDWPSLFHSTSTAKRNTARTSTESEDSEFEGIMFTNYIKSDNTQIGDSNVIINKRCSTPGQQTNEAYKDISPIHTAGPTSKSYANIAKPIVANTVNIQYNIGGQNTRKEASAKERRKREDYEKFIKLTADFSHGHYLLVVGRVENVKNLSVFGHVPWTAVLDFDPNSRRNGLLSFVESTLERNRFLHINTWQDKCNFTDTSTCWLLMKGSTDRLDTLVESDFKTWKMSIKQQLQSLMKQLETFKQGSTEYTVIVIWPNDTEMCRYLNFILAKIEDRLSPTFLLVQEGNDMSNLSSDFFDSIEVLEMTVNEVCHAIGRNFDEENELESVLFKLPTSDGSNNPDIDEKEAHALNEELEVLYINDTTGIQYTLTELQEEEDNFFRGGTLPWAWWYHMGSGHADAERDIKDRIVKFIKTDHIKMCKSGCVTLYHFPGSGGTTLAQSVLWHLRKDIPCVQVKHRNDQSLIGLAEMVQLLSEKTHLPVLILMDGEEEQKVEHIQRSLQCCSIIFYIKRCLKMPKLFPGVFWLKPYVSKKEGNHVGKKYLDQCLRLKKGERQQKAIKILMEGIVGGNEHSIFEFGLAVHSYEYKGICSYVDGLLQLKINKSGELYPWQRALAVLSIAHYYGQTSVPCHLCSTMIPPRPPSTVLHFKDFPMEMKEFIVCDPHERRSNVVRISHYYIAKEILDQVLLWQQGIEGFSKRETSPYISSKSKVKLEPLVVDFIKNAGKVNHNVVSDTIKKVLIRTIILRDNTAVGENETQATRTKRPKFSPIIEDVSSRPPYTERFTVLQTLTESFPSEPQFYAHLGRLYALCRPEKEKEAEECFKKALEICEYENRGMTDDEIPSNMKLTLMHVFHMHGSMFSTRVAQYTGKHIHDTPKISIDASNVEEFSQKLLQNTRLSCNYFNKCREITPPGCEKSVGYINEINVRLMFCDFISRHKCNNRSKSIISFIEKDTSELGEFVGECFTKLDELFIDCFSSIEPEKMDPSVWNCQKWFVHLFKTSMPGHLVYRDMEGMETSRRKIVMLKMEYSDPKSLGVLDLVTRAEDIRAIVGEYEKIFDIVEQDRQKHRISKRDVDIDYREWLFAIRHPKFPTAYTIERVLLRVQRWFEIVHTQNARFYLFIMKTLLGFGDNENDGNTEVLIEAQRLKAELVQYSKYMAKPKYPREWLGPTGMRIRRITPGKRFFGQIEENQNWFSTSDLKLEIMKGTICPPNDKPAVGYISLDLGPANRVPVKIFYVPAISLLKGGMNKGARVEFVIGFSMSHGYEAFNVQKIGKVLCGTCKKTEEFKSCDTFVRCSSCNSLLSTKRNGSPKKE